MLIHRRGVLLDHEQVLAALSEWQCAPWAAFISLGLRANGTTWLASASLALAEAGRLDQSAEWLASARAELTEYGDWFAESTVLLAEAALLRARGQDPKPVLLKAHEIATEQGANAMAARVDRMLRRQADAQES